MTRQRVEESIHSQMFVNCPYCHGRGSVKSPLALSVDLQRQIGAAMRRIQRKGDPHLQIVVHPMVLDRLRREDEKFLMELQEEFHGTMSFKSDATRHVESFSIVDHDTGKVIYSADDEG
jgi:ribonuclease G